MKRALIVFESTTIGKILFALGALLFCLFALNFEPHTDDEFLGEQLYWLLEDGHVRSNLMSGFRDIGIEETWTVFHKGVIYYGYIWCKIFGWSVFSLQFGSITLCLLFIFLLWNYFKQEENRFAKNAFLLVCSVSFLFYYFTWCSTRFRPEILEMVLGFFSFLQLSKFLKGKKFAWIPASIASGLAMLAHMNGLIIIAAGFMVLVFNRKWITSFLFGGLAVLIFLSTYFADVLLFADFSYFKNQFLNDPALNPSHFHWYSPLLKIPQELSRYFHADVDSIFAVPFFLTLVLAFRYFKKERKNMLVYMLTMLIVLSFYTYNKKTIFMVPIFPYMAIFFVEGIHFLVKEKANKLFPWIAVFLFLCYFPSAAVLLSIKTAKLYQRSITTENNEIGAIIGENNRVMAEGKFIFHEIKRQSFIINETQFTFFRSFHGQEFYTFNQFIDKAIDLKLDYIIFKEGRLKDFRNQLSREDERFKTVEANDRYAIVKINPVNYLR